MNTQEFPLSDYYKRHVIEGVTLSKSQGWWSAMLLIEEPRNGKPFIGLYKWQEVGDKWKVRAKFKINRKEDASSIQDILNEYSLKLI
jgi:hypothetical protein